MPEIVTLLTPGALAEKLDCSTRTLERRRLVGDGPPFIKIGQKIRYPLPAFEKWLEANTRSSTSQAVTPAVETTAKHDRRDRIERRKRTSASDSGGSGGASPSAAKSSGRKRIPKPGEDGPGATA